MAKKSKADYKIKSSHGEKIFRVANIIFMCLLCVITIYPLFYILIYSLNEGTDSLRGGLYLFPRVFTTFNFEYVLSNGVIKNSYLVDVYKRQDLYPQTEDGLPVYALGVMNDMQLFSIFLKAV